MILITNSLWPTPRLDLAKTQLHAALLQKQQQVNAQSGDMLFIELVISYDGMFEVKLNNVEDDHGQGESFDLDEAFQQALDMLIGMREAHLEAVQAERPELPDFVYRRFPLKRKP